MPLLDEISTTRLLIRPLDPTRDAPALPSDPALAVSDEEKWLLWAVDYDSRMSRLYKPPRGPNALILKATGELVGLAGIIGCLIPFELMPEPEEDEPFNPSSEVDGIFYDIHPAQRGKGYATEASQALIDYAFNVMHIERITATTDNNNQASINVIKKLGMRIKYNTEDDFPGFPFYMEVVGVVRNPERRQAGVSEGRKEG